MKNTMPTAMNKPLHSWRARVAKSLCFWSNLALLCVLLGQLGAWHWFLELLSHFSAHAIPLLLITALASRGYWRLWFSSMSVVLLLWALSPLSIFIHSASLITGNRLVMANVNIIHPDPHSSVSALVDTGAEILVLIEAGGEHWQPALQSIRDAYPHHCGYDNMSSFAMQLYAKIPMVCEQKAVLGYSYIRAVIPGNTATVIYGLHPPPPMNAQLARHRDHYLQVLAERIRAEGSPVMVTGDLNLSGFSPIFRRFIRQAQLTQHQPNFYPTWWPFYLSIDHALFRDVETVSIYRLSRQGSDHQPLVIDW